MYYMKIKKSPTHIHFLTKNFIDSRQFLHYDFVIFSVFYMRIMQSENFAANIHTHYRQSETAPYIRALYARKISPRYIWKIAARLESVRYWLGVDIFAFVCIMFCICGHHLDKDVFVDWLMSNFGYKNVIKLYKFIVKMWLCRCNCMCICVCIWYWLWFCYHLNSVVIRL